MTSLWSRLSPVPAFPEYTGPYKVGTVDVEIPVSELDAPSPAPDCAASIHTILFRVFYPAVTESDGGPITWLPAPQRLHVSAYTQFLGVGPMAASVLSLLPRHLHYTYIRVHKNAHLLPPETPNGRWPTMIFSHGLGGTRNAYSHLAGSLASHGLVVVCPEHRDGSSVVSLVRDPANQHRFFIRATRRVIPYRRVAHVQTPDVWAARDDQLRIRLWELGLSLDAVLRIAGGDAQIPRANMNKTTTGTALSQFAERLDVQEPGKIIWAGHSFGAASIVQLLKSTYYAGTPELQTMTEPLFTPQIGCNLHRQITARSATMLLDMWCFPLLSAATDVLFKLALPQYADIPSAPGGNALLAVQSGDFFKWKENLHVMARVLSPEPSERVVEPTAFERPDTGIKLSEPNFFYVENSAHLNQSDFGILFPWLTKRVFGAQEPERVLRLNLRAQLQFLRSRGVPVARTWIGDLVEDAHVGKGGLGSMSAAGIKGLDDGVDEDPAIFDRGGNGRVQTWHAIDMMGMGGESAATEMEVRDRAQRPGSSVDKEHDGREDFLDVDEQQLSGDGEDGEREMQCELEPSLGNMKAAGSPTVPAVASAVA
ncbi:hypothetical protein P8C59_002871 [Phyllachora maydis]|uniref:Putative phospholipase n=1 Tax=Phyllachora maydis TaxID=1825666 RepID=A0AAD9HZB4_9PEZI|nr:hypothetical protein P8C59_002871 [Phyllachora maydis]